MAKKQKQQSARQKRISTMLEKVAFGHLLEDIAINKIRSSFWIIFGIIGLISATVSILFDLFMPMQGLLYSTLRATVAIIAGISFFSLIYAVICFQSDANRARFDESLDDEHTKAMLQEMNLPDHYVTLREKFSVRQRRRQLYPVIALIFVLAMTSAYTRVYTLFGGIVLALIIGCFAYIRLTDDETVLMDNGIPDARDIIDLVHEYEEEDTRKAERRRRREEKREMAAKSKNPVKI